MDDCSRCTPMAACDLHQDPNCAACASRKTRHLDYGHSPNCPRNALKPGPTSDELKSQMAAIKVAANELKMKYGR